MGVAELWEPLTCRVWFAPHAHEAASSDLVSWAMLRFAVAGFASMSMPSGIYIGGTKYMFLVSHITRRVFLAAVD